jgi:hypothetical protein
VAAGDQLDVGAVRLTFLVDDDSEAEAAVGYWENSVDGRGDLSFTGTLKERQNTFKAAEYVARFAAAELIGLKCRTCGNLLRPMDTEGRTHARALWKAQHSPTPGKAISCDNCTGKVRDWVRNQDHPAPVELNLHELLAAQSLRESDIYRDVLHGNDLANTLPHPDVQVLVQSVLAPLSATGPDAVDLTDGSFYPSRINWRFAGIGTPSERLNTFEENLNNGFRDVIRPESFDELLAAASRCIEDDVLNYLGMHLQDRKWPALDETQQARIRQLVSSNWGTLNMCVFYNIGWSAFRSAANLKSLQDEMARASLVGYVVNEFGKSIERILDEAGGFTAAQIGMLYVRDVVPVAIIDDALDEVTEMRNVAITKAMPHQ